MNHRVVRSGSWLYDGSVVSPVHLIQTDYDFWYETTRADGTLEPGEHPELNPEGHLYYVCFREVPSSSPLWVDSEGFPSLGLAEAHAQSKVAGPITWL